ncbi:hypothetical protein OA383_01225 [Candidatus Pelagibacter bacterium]|nr:hypothetical protein [Candidatus Pelagibacter bacterium]
MIIKKNIKSERLADPNLIVNLLLKIYIVLRIKKIMIFIFITKLPAINEIGRKNKEICRYEIKLFLKNIIKLIYNK